MLGYIDGCSNSVYWYKLSSGNKTISLNYVAVPALRSLRQTLSCCYVNYLKTYMGLCVHVSKRFWRCGSDS